ncbi:MAG: DUF5668 domain-containing protein [Candidatus Pseudobacter hemicellulosilyticus]|uniref:DUF5668 domain-containing protein n=1 Tax=Candidatus Pseudobacter hemicellulosilyticus TaxID=3121375 RepID=A0AAJ5WS09_9BACT|nr:MAG: DUF5668 domain-containing protein [Pseudobacter sp.]
MQDNIFPAQEQHRRRERRGRKHNNLWAGLLLLAIGSLLLMRKLGMAIPGWLFSWPMILIVVGLFVGAANRFRDFSWIILTGIGTFFLIDRLVPGVDFGDFIFPAIIIGVGLAVIFGSRRRRRRPLDPHGEPLPLAGPGQTGTTNARRAYDDTDDTLDIASIFGGMKRIIYSKNFKGGEVVNIFGGSELDLTNADFNGVIEIEMVQIFGGAKLIVPAHWEVRTGDAVAIFGGFDDKRSRQAITNPDKVLIIRGTTIFGGLDIKSF